MQCPTFSLWACFTGTLSLFSSLLFDSFSSRNVPALCCHSLASVALSVVRFGGRLAAKAGVFWPGLRFLDGHRAIFQKRGELCAVYLQAPVVADQALPLELVHEFAYPWTGGANHLREG